jgi:hypothetical protein
MTQKTQTLIIYPNGDIAKRIDNFLYQPITSVIILKDEAWKIHSKQDEFDCEGWLVRKIHLTK